MQFPTDLALAFVASIVLGFSHVLMRRVTQAQIPPKISVICKLTLMAAGAWILHIGWGYMEFSWLLAVLVLALIGVGMFANYAIYATYRNNKTGVGAALISTAPILIYPLALLIKLEDFSVWGVFGIGLATVGIMTMTGVKVTRKTIAWPLSAALGLGLRALVISYILHNFNVHVFTLMALQLTGVSLGYLVTTSPKTWQDIWHKHIDNRRRILQSFMMQATFELLFTSLIMTAYQLTNHPTRVLAVVETNAIWAALLAWVWFRERLSKQQWLGVFIVIIAVLWLSIMP